MYNYYPYSIIIKSEQISKINLPEIKLSFDEYIIGSTISNDNDINDIYSLYVKQDTNNIIFESQTIDEGLCINIGIDNRPTSSSYDIQIIPEEKDSIISISKDNILDKMKNKEKNDISDINLIIGFYNSLANSTFSFVAHLENDINNKIYEITLEKKVLCKTIKSKENENRCLF